MLKHVAAAVLAAVTTIVVVTGVFRILPASVPTAVPFVVAVLAGAALWWVPDVPRSVPAGIVAGAVVYAGFVYYVLLSWG